MKKFILIWLTFAATSLFAADGYLARSNNVIVIGPGGSGGGAASTFDANQFSSASGGTNIVSGALLTNITVIGTATIDKVATTNVTVNGTGVNFVSSLNVSSNLSVTNITASRVVLSDANHILTNAIASGAVPINADGTATTAGQLITVTIRKVGVSDATSFTPNADTTDICVQTNTQTAGTLTISNPTGTPVAGQKLMIRIKSTNIQTFAFGNQFRGSTDLSFSAFPTTSGSSLWDYMSFVWNESSSTWDVVAKNFGF